MRFSPPIAVLIAALLAIRVAAQPPVEPLATPITATVVDTPLKTWLAELGEQAGVTLRTAPDYEDRAITARVHELPLGRLMNAIAALYEDVWEKRDRNGRVTYTLTASGRRRNLQARLTRAHDTAQRGALLQYAAELAEHGPPPPIFPGPPPTERGNREMMGRGRLISKIPPRLLDALLAGELIRVKMDEIPGPFGEEMRAFKAQFATPDGPPIPGQDRDPVWVLFSASQGLGMGPELPGLARLCVNWHLTGGDVASGFGLVAFPGRAEAAVDDATRNLLRDRDQDPDARRRAGGAALARAAAPAAGRPLARSQLLVALAERANVDLIADSHTKRPMPTLTPSELAPNATLEDALDHLCGEHASLWRIEEGPIFTVRSRYWYIDDAREPPATKIAEWNRLLDENGTLTLDQAVEMAALPPQQHGRLRLRIPEARGVSNSVLHLYGRLSPTQKRAVRENGLLLLTLPANLRGALIDPAWTAQGLRSPASMERLTHPAAALRIVDHEWPPGTPPTPAFYIGQLDESGEPIRGTGEIGSITLPRREGGATRPGLAPIPAPGPAPPRP